MRKMDEQQIYLFYIAFKIIYVLKTCTAFFSSSPITNRKKKVIEFPA